MTNDNTETVLMVVTIEGLNEDIDVLDMKDESLGYKIQQAKEQLELLRGQETDIIVNRAFRQELISRMKLIKIDKLSLSKDGDMNTPDGQPIYGFNNEKLFAMFNE